MLLSNGETAWLGAQNCSYYEGILEDSEGKVFKSVHTEVSVQHVTAGYSSDLGPVTLAQEACLIQVFILPGSSATLTSQP